MGNEVKEGYKEVQLIGESLEIPLEWKIEKLDNQINILSGYAFDSDCFNNEENGVPLIRIRNLQESKISTYYNGEYDDRYIVKKEDVLIGMDGNFYVIKWNNGNGLLNQRVCKVESESKALNQDYLYYRIKPEIKKIHRITPATTVKHLSIKDVKKIRIPIPPLPEQEKIADILSAVDEKLQKIDAIIKKTKKLKKGLMQELLTKGIGHSEFKEVRIGPKKYTIPQSWKVVNFEDITSNEDNSFRRGPFGGSLKKEIFVDSGYKVYQQKNVIYKDFNLGDYYITQEKYNEMKKFSLKSGDILISCSGTLGEIAITPNKFEEGIINQALLKISLNQNKYSNRFIKYLLETELGRMQLIRTSRGSAMKNMAPMRVIKKSKILTPPLKEQKKIANILSSVDEKIEKKQEEKEKVEKLKKGLMQKLLTGEVRVNV